LVLLFALGSYKQIIFASTLKRDNGISAGLFLMTVTGCADLRQCSARADGSGPIVTFKLSLTAHSAALWNE
jgi:hypothetical protein